MTMPSPNVDGQVVRGFGDEWRRFDQSSLSDDELQALFDGYFRIFPWESLPAGAQGMDIGCGTGRWARVVAPRVGRLMCIDASGDAIAVAQRNLSGQPNCEVCVATVDSLPVPDHSLDFAYSLGVLHHVPDTEAAIRSCAAKLKPGAPFLVYLYYAFDNRPAWFRFVFFLSEPMRFVVSRLMPRLRYGVSQLIAAAVYWPLARLARTAERVGIRNVDPMPLSYYRDRSFYIMRNDALDRFGTRIQKRFTRDEITAMMVAAGFTGVRFSDQPPFWCAVARKA